MLCGLTDGCSANQPAARSGGKDGGQVSLSPNVFVGDCHTPYFQNILNRCTPCLTYPFIRHALSLGGRLLRLSIALCAIQLSGQAELVERCLHVFQCPVLSSTGRNPAVSRCVRPDVLYRDGGGYVAIAISTIQVFLFLKMHLPSSDKNIFRLTYLPHSIAEDDFQQITLH